MKFQRQKGFGLFGVIVVAAVIALLVGGGFYWKEAQNQKSLLQSGNDALQKAEELKAKIKRQNKASVGKTTTDTSNWKIYRNEKYGFEVRYPASMIIFTKILEEPDVHYRPVPPEGNSSEINFTKDVAVYGATGEAFTASIKILNDEVVDFHKWLRDTNIISRYTEYRITREGMETFLDMLAYRVYAPSAQDSPGNLVIFNRGGKTFFLRYDDDPDFEKILATIRFL